MVHVLEQVGRAADLGEPGGGRTIARCSCGWGSRAALTVSLALSDLDGHLDGHLGVQPDVAGAA